MHSFYLCQKDAEASNRLIVFFNGWGMDEYPILPFIGGDYDCLLLFDYRKKNRAAHQALLQEYLPRYKDVYLIAFSFGVAIAQELLSCCNNLRKHIKCAIAINGTCSPISEDKGIARMSFHSMLESLSEEGVQAFNALMCRKFLSQYQAHCPKRSYISQREELAYLYHNLQETCEADAIFHYAIIGKGDLVIPAKNQRQAWRATPQTVFAAPHYIFPIWNDLWDIVELADPTVLTPSGRA